MNKPDPQAMVTAWLSQLTDQSPWQSWFKSVQPANVNPIADILKEAGAKIAPVTVTRLQNEYIQQLAVLWQNFLVSKGVTVLTDRRFSSDAWQSNTFSSFNAAVYLLNARFLMSLAEAVEATPRIKQKIAFAVQQMVDAMSPANFLATNPEAQQKILDTKGESLAKGLALMLADMQKGRISQTDESVFEVGKNVATSEGAVVFENALFQLIQYKPLTKTVFEKPLLIVPPCINKFYILDLQPENSLVRYAVEQGHTVFLVSWRNPDDSMTDVTWDSYIEDVAIKAIHVVQKLSGQDRINALGFCVGGTIVSTALAVLYARGEEPIASLTLLTTLLDFTDTGVLDIFIDETQVKMREQEIGKGGLLPGRDLASTFSSLRANDLVWNYVQSNYLKGETPPPFDLLYWNADSTNLPGPMFCWYLRNTYLENSLKVPGKLTVAGEQIDLGAIDAPVFIFGSREDHIVPWGSAYASTAILNPEQPDQNRFVLGASGHIAGVINPPAKNKRSYWTNDALSQNSEAWLETATEHPGSWWPEWSAFLVEHAGKQMKAPSKLGNAAFKPIEDAPGRYVKVRAN
ncbi:MAG: class I poly(R)-hydroxyalkanoic acid synthase [Glaciimonas sp.]|nr:class I poly(R)-hydroxyalkanoic acid synthase [Glaciimonas sp.]